MSQERPLSRHLTREVSPEPRLVAPPYEYPVPGESGLERSRRSYRNANARREWLRITSLRCSVCGLANINVRHNVNPVDQTEGPDYYADVDVHEFRP